ncbi:hypothetical protein AB5J62_33375 [Amycolatopsis sp. cg5]|uniref:hypothetical protein n=1 Tax=Amycolatopsis sp. cg5 TaxID=3238802 RepID=UPI003524683B
MTIDPYDNVAEDWTIKPRSVRAVQLTEANFDRVLAWIERAGGDVPWTGDSPFGGRSLSIYTRDGEETIIAGHYIVHDQQRGEWHVAKADRFVADHDHQPKGR